MLSIVVCGGFVSDNEMNMMNMMGIESQVESIFCNPSCM